MKVSICQKCPHYKRKRWTHRHQSANYHAIGMTHAYGYCEEWGKRCSEVSNADCWTSRLEHHEPLVCCSCGAEIAWPTPEKMYICSSDYMGINRICRSCLTEKKAKKEKKDEL